MESKKYEIDGIPVAWTTHRGFGKKSFNPHYKEKQAAQWQLKIQHGERPLYKRAVCVDFFFEMPIPKSMPKKIRKLIESGHKVYHEKRPDGTNLRKHAEDCLTGTILFDDNLIVNGTTQKYYAKDKPKTLIFVQQVYEAIP